MGLKKKFFLLSGLVGLFMAVISIIGFYTAYTNLAGSVEEEFEAVVSSSAYEMDGWLQSKGTTATHTAAVLEGLEGNPAQQLQGVLGAAANDREILDVIFGREDGSCHGYYGGDMSAIINPPTRVWYSGVRGMNSGYLLVTEAYQDARTKKMVVTAASPVKPEGRFVGAVCVDITLDTLQEKAAAMKYRGEGSSYVIEKNGNVLAADNKDLVMQNISADSALGQKFAEMLENRQGVFFTDGDDGSRVVAYVTMPVSGWLACVSVDESFVFADVNNMKFIYGVLTVVGILVTVAICLKMSNQIVASVLELKEYAEQISTGNLRLEKLSIISEDEIGNLSRSFNTMSDNIRRLIAQMAGTAEQVAASSEELTASANQSAESAVQVASAVGDVSRNMYAQLGDIDKAKEHVDVVFGDVRSMADKAKVVNQASQDTAKAAQEGSHLMKQAVANMGVIEQSVMESAAMVKKLGENSQAIGQIVEAISSIADQTNLLALNAAIEAARAGDAGRGFAVVAEEVRKLASESQSSAEEIRERIGSIQADTQHTVAAMEKGTGEVAEGTKAIRQVGDKFQGILGMVNDIQAQMLEIQASVDTVSNGATEIVQSVDGIDSISRRTAESTKVISGETEQQSASNEEIAAAAQALSNLAAEMQNAIGKFRL